MAENPDHFLNRIFLFPFLLSAHLLSALGYWLYYYNISHVFTICFSCAFSLVTIFFIKMRQLTGELNHIIKQFSVDKTINNKSQKTNAIEEGQSYFLYSKFRASFRQTLILFLQTNRMYGRLFLATFLVFCPMNVFFAHWLLNGHVPSENQIFMAFFTVYQANLIFLLHLLLAHCTVVLHRPKSQFIRLYITITFSAFVQNTQLQKLSSLENFPSTTGKIKYKKYAHFRRLLRLSLDAELLNTDNRYGWTYGNFGLISLKAFAKV